MRIITTEPNHLMAEIHNRMPVIIGDEDMANWLGETPLTPDQAKALLRPFPAERMTTWRVSPAVGNVKNMGPELLEPVVA